MKRNQFLMAVTAAALGSAAVVGCGDNSKQCGPGTTDVDGVCTGGDTGSICGDGTVLDTATNTCVPSDDVCGDGTVLVNGTCQDPTSGLAVDLEEGPEPNGFEMGATPAGTITLKPAGGPGFVIHGCIKPTDNFTADIDDYLLTVTGPTLIKISADGVKGLAAGFIAFGDLSDPLLSSWLRLGINVTTDTSKRELFLPAAGTYDIVFADTRSLMPITDGVNDLPPAGNPDGSSCYYATVDFRNIPTPTTLALTGASAGDSGTIGEDLKFYTGAFPDGYTSLTAVIDPEDIDGDGTLDVNSRAASSLVLLNNNTLRQINDSDSNSPISAAFFAGIKAGDTPLLVLDYVWNYAVGPADYAITVDAALDSDALPTDGTTVQATGGSHGQFFQDPATGNIAFNNLNLFHFDVAAPSTTDGFDLLSSIQLTGVVADQDGFILSQFTGLGGNAASSTTFNSYVGLLRFAAPGRYYFVVFAPRNPPATAFNIKSTITVQTPTVAMLDTPTPSIPVNQFNSNLVAYNAGTVEPWQLFNGTGVGTGNLTVTAYDPNAAFGRLDTLSVRNGAGAGTVGTQPSDVPAVDQVVLAANGSTPAGRILRNPVALTPPALTNFLLKVNPAVLTGTRSFIADIKTRVYHDFATLAVGTTAPVTNEPIDAGNPSRRYFLETAPGNIVTITVTPTGTPVATLNAAISLINNAEAATRTVNASPITGAETLKLTQNASGFTAFTVQSAGALATTGSYSLTVKIDPPFYAVSNSATPFADACLGGGTTQTLASGDPDEGLTGPIAAPAGFTYYGAATTSFVASTNGFLAFDTTITNSNFNVSPLPDGLGETNIAPFWDDAITTICTKTVGGKLVVQWTGEEFSFFGGGATVAFQTILDPTDDSIEFVWGTMQADGSNGVSGVQTLAGDEATSVGTFSAFISPNTSKKLTHL